MPKMTPFTYQGLKVKVLVDVRKWAPFDNEFHIRAGEVGIVEKTIGDCHYVKVNGGLSQRVKITDTELVYP